MANVAFAEEFAPFECKAKIFYTSGEQTNSQSFEIDLVASDSTHPEFLKGKSGNLAFSASALYAMPSKTPVVLLSISIYQNRSQKQLNFKTSNSTSELFEKGKTSIVAYNGVDETIALICKLK
jgi:hypothetical protein